MYLFIRILIALLIGEKINAYRMLERELLKKLSRGRPERGWEGSVNMDVKVTNCDDVK
jgi:hypothetical protein